MLNKTMKEKIWQKHTRLDDIRSTMRQETPTHYGRVIDTSYDNYIEDAQQRIYMMNMGMIKAKKVEEESENSEI